MSSDVLRNAAGVFHYVIQYKYSIISKIKADYLVKSVLENNVSFVFFLREKNKNFYIANSIFPMESYDYSLGQVKYALLFKEKVNLKENISEILFQHRNFSPKKNP